MPNILIVDDNPVNLKILEDMLQLQNYEVRSFPRGRLALNAALRHLPDLILLDINMPEMTGYEVCEQFKSTEATASIPIIFLSALGKTEDKVKAFRAGAVDFIAKPFQIEEVQARVETHLKLHALQRELTRQNEQLETLVKARTQELADANRRLSLLDRSKNEFLNLISHEFRTPLHGVLGIGELILDQMEVTPESRELLDMFNESRERILSILDDALLLTEIDVSGGQFKPVPVSVDAAMTRAIERTADFAKNRYVTIVPPPSVPYLVPGTDDLLTRAFHALLVTAVKYSHEGGEIRPGFQKSPGSLVVGIPSHGYTIPEAGLPEFFDLYSATRSVRQSADTGLAPPVAYGILTLFSAAVAIANTTPPGIEITCRFDDQPA